MRDSLRERAHLLTRHAGTPLPMAMATPVSMANEFFESPTFEAYCKEREAEQKLAIAMLDRIGGVAKQVNMVGRLIAKRPA